MPIEEELVVVEELDGWVKIAIEEGDGYVSRDYVNLSGQISYMRSPERKKKKACRRGKSA